MSTPRSCVGDAERLSLNSIPGFDAAAGREIEISLWARWLLGALRASQGNRGS